MNRDIFIAFMIVTIGMMLIQHRTNNNFKGIMEIQKQQLEIDSLLLEGIKQNRQIIEQK